MTKHPDNRTFTANGFNAMEKCGGTQIIMSSESEIAVAQESCRYLRLGSMQEIPKTINAAALR